MLFRNHEPSLHSLMRIFLLRTMFQWKYIQPLFRCIHDFEKQFIILLTVTSSPSKFIAMVPVVTPVDYNPYQ